MKNKLVKTAIRFIIGAGLVLLFSLDINRSNNLSLFRRAKDANWQIRTAEGIITLPQEIYQQIWDRCRVKRKDILETIRIPSYIEDEYSQRCWSYYSDIDENTKLRVVVDKKSLEIVTAHPQEKQDISIKQVQVPDLYNRECVRDVLRNPEIIIPTSYDFKLYKKIDWNWYVVAVREQTVVNVGFMIGNPVATVLNDELLKAWAEKEE